jgi:glycerophosphoryl diester phosphodiesterase
MTDLTWLRRELGRPPVIVAHRGASGLAPENTLAAFALAVEQGTPCVECDVHLSADGVPVVIHDDRVNRTTDGEGEVAALSFADLRRLDAGGWFDPAFRGQRLPTLDEALAACAGRARLFVELKVGGGEALVAAALAAVERAAGTDVAVISFDPTEVRLVAQRRPDLPVGYLVARRQVQVHGPSWVIETAQQLGATFVSPQHDVVDAAFVALAHSAGFPVSAWTVDEPARMRALAGAGVDALTTNRPDVALSLFR